MLGVWSFILNLACSLQPLDSRLRRHPSLPLHLPEQMRAIADFPRNAYRTFLHLANFQPIASAKFRSPRRLIPTVRKTALRSADRRVRTPFACVGFDVRRIK